MSGPFVRTIGDAGKILAKTTPPAVEFSTAGAHFPPRALYVSRNPVCRISLPLVPASCP